MKTLVLFAGVMIASAALAEPNDPLAEERYRMKYGRYTPAEETRRRAGKDVTGYVAQSCCRHLKHETSTGQLDFNSPGTEAYFRAKYGRSASAFEALERAAKEQTEMHIGKCAGLGRCPLVAAHKSTASTDVVAANISDIEARFRAKYGRSTPDLARHAGSSASEQLLLPAAADHVPCAEACCRQSE